jgi:cytidine deaminase
MEEPDTSMDADQPEQMLRAAERAREAAYAPYSRFPVGAAVLAGGEVYTGCNVENASYGLTICAERVAVFAAVAAGHRRIEAVAVVSAHRPTTPCGACRQVLHEFGPEMVVVMQGPDGAVMRQLSDLLPLAFDSEALPSSE